MTDEEVDALLGDPFGSVLISTAAIILPLLLTLLVIVFASVYKPKRRAERGVWTGPLVSESSFMRRLVFSLEGIPVFYEPSDYYGGLSMASDRCWRDYLFGGDVPSTYNSIPGDTLSLVYYRVEINGKRPELTHSYAKSGNKCFNFRIDDYCQSWTNGQNLIFNTEHPVFHTRVLKASNRNAEPRPLFANDKLVASVHCPSCSNVCQGRTPQLNRLSLHGIYLSVYASQRQSSDYNSTQTNKYKQPCQDNESFIPTVLIRLDRYWSGKNNSAWYAIGCFAFCLLIGLIGGFGFYKGRNRFGIILMCLAGLLDVAGTFILGSPWGNEQECTQSEQNEWHLPSSNLFSVTQKYPLTNLHLCNTVFIGGDASMANVLDRNTQAIVIGALAEGSSIRSIERMTGVHRDTIMRLGVKVGQGCTELLDSKMRNLPCENLQLDEIWGFIGKKEGHRRPDDNSELGDVWTFCAIDSDTKIVPSFRVGKRDRETANAFVDDLSSRLTNRVQLSTDALRAYVEAVELAFGSDVDYAQIVKEYGKDEDYSPERKYSPSVVLSVEKKRMMGNPDMALASTSYVERLNGTTRLHMRRLTRLTYAFSKKLDNFKAAVGLHFAYYNFCLRHAALRCTPAMEAGIERDFWSVRDLLEATA